MGQRTIKKIKQQVRRDSRAEIKQMVDKLRLVIRRKPKYLPLFIWAGLIRMFFNVAPRDPINGGDFDVIQRENVGGPSSKDKMA